MTLDVSSQATFLIALAITATTCAGVFFYSLRKIHISQKERVGYDAFIVSTIASGLLSFSGYLALFISWGTSVFDVMICETCKAAVGG